MTRRRFARTAEAFLASTGKKSAAITTEDVREFLAAKSEDIAATSQAALLVHLRAFFKALVKAKLVDHDATEGLSVKHGGHPPQLVLSRESLDTLFKIALEPVAPEGRERIAQALALRTRACVELLYGLGVRASEAARILVTDLSLADGTVIVKGAKGGDVRALPVPRAALKHLERYLREGRPALVKPDGRDRGHLLLSYAGNALDADEVKVIVRRLAKRARVRGSPHAFRRTVATDLVRAGVNVEAVRQFLGHARLSTTQLYVDVDKDDRRRAVEALDLDRQG